MSDSLSQLLTERPNPASEGLDRLPVRGILEVVNEADVEVAQAVERAIPALEALVVRIVDRLEHEGRLFYLGAGTSGRLGVLDASECPPTFSVPPWLVQGIIAGGESALARASEASEDDPAAGGRDLLAAGFTARDVLVGISASGRTPYVLGAIAEAGKLGALTGGISCTPDSELSRVVDYPVELVVGPEVIAGSTRMRAGTATKMALNMISTAAMVKLGHVYGNLMVNVQPKNRKLEDRARRIIQAVTGVSEEDAANLLRAAENNVKTAIVMHKLGVQKTFAERLLAAARGRIREAIELG